MVTRIAPDVVTIMIPPTAHKSMQTAAFDALRQHMLSNLSLKNTVSNIAFAFFH